MEKEPLEITTMCAGCGGSIVDSESLCLKCEAGLLDGRTAWIDASNDKKVK